jgi:acetate kinase
MRGILAVNGGSSSLKCRLFDVGDEQLRALAAVSVSDIGTQPRWHVEVAADGNSTSTALAALEGLPAEQRHACAIGAILRWIDETPALPAPCAIGHRVVHGGDVFHEPHIVDEVVLDVLRGLARLAPLHQPLNIALIEACTQAAPEALQVACFDTMFHQGQSRLERDYALPRELSEAGIRRYGFHGLSYEFVSSELARINPQAWAGRCVIAHLGAGASLCAVQAGASVATSMGFSTLDGVPMGTRCGSIDPGVLIHLLREGRFDLDALEELLYRRSGLLGVSGISGQVQALRQSGAAAAQFALQQFAYRIAREIGSLAAAMGGIDALVFTGGIGENDALLRAAVSEHCGWLGARLDGARNAAHAPLISSEDSRIALHVIATSEETLIARHTRAIAWPDAPGTPQQRDHA